MFRHKCCICDGNLVQCYDLPKFPVRYTPTTAPLENDKFENLKFGYCEVCGSFQLMTLIDQELLYGEAHNNSSFSTVWTLHHDNFSKFISCRLGKDKSIIEIGGASLELWKRLKEYNYTVMDLTDKYFDYNVNFIKGNCETYKFKETDNVVMSHVFEHLYNPNQFIDNCEAENIFLSIPDMRSGIVPVHIEHTYFLEPDDIIRMFSKRGYTCDIEYYQNASSYFIHAYKGECKYNIPLNPGRYKYVLEFYINLEKKCKNINVDNFYISPACLGGVFLWYFTNKSVKGFIDNDHMKQEKRQYGTPYYIYNRDVLNSDDTLIINHRVFANEIKKQLKCKIIEL